MRISGWNLRRRLASARFKFSRPAPVSELTATIGRMRRIEKRFAQKLFDLQPHHIQSLGDPPGRIWSAR